MIQRFGKAMKLAMVSLVLLLLGVGVGVMIKAIRKQSKNPKSELVSPSPTLEKEVLEVVKEGPKAWPKVDADGVSTIELSLREGMPTLSYKKERLNLMPNAAKLELSWSLQRLEKSDVFVGTGSWENRPVLFTWTFAENNPQAMFAFKFLDEDAAGVAPNNNNHAKKDQAVVGRLQWEFPSQSISNVADSALKNKSRLQVSGLDKHILFSNGSYSNIDYLESEKKGEPLYVNTYFNLCPGGEQGGRFTLTFAPSDLKEIPNVQILPKAFSEQILVPIFVFPSVDQVARNSSAKDSQMMIDQIRALLYGHSDPDDPRYGTSGILNTELSATFVVPPTVDVHEIREKIGVSDRVEIIPSSIWKDGKTQFGEGAKGCSLMFEFSLNHDNLQQKNPIFLTPEEISFGVLPPSTLQLTNVPQFDEISNILRSSEFKNNSDPSLIGITARAIIVSRNPLVEQTRESLLAPARYGHWQVSEQFSQMLANMGESIQYNPKAPMRISRYKTLEVARKLAEKATTLDVWYQPEGDVEADVNTIVEGKGVKMLAVDWKVN